MKEKLNLWIEPEDKRAIEKLRQKESREFSDMARLVIKDGIKVRSKKNAK